MHKSQFETVDQLIQAYVQCFIADLDQALRASQ